ncbi:hypothetical protein ABL78_4532 [Leptomonas seymouri]|uniref:Uncharacterized protein n=1 Tax=Leptomonas seymouri TaxID=5684 RepID=A0A0N0P5F8_LEPSE|nr:hypothetical protein ABL78_4532 [Leptomonas seymouri]|eukprot:KPI86416.1 hypothetical protein ABL78_4532 [Leptomonas seymouri]
MEAHISSSQFTIEKQRRAASPGAGSARSLSSSSHPHHPGGSATSTGGGSDHNMESELGESQQRPETAKGANRRTAPQHHVPTSEGGHGTPGKHQHLQHHVSGGGDGSSVTAAPAASSLFDTTMLASSTSIPSGDGGGAMAHLLDSVASSSSSPPSSQTPPRGTVWRSPGNRGRAGTSEQEYRHRHAEQQPQRQPHQRTLGEQDPTSARQARKPHSIDEEFTTLFGETPVWPRPSLKAQSKPSPQQAHTSASARPFQEPQLGGTPTPHRRQRHHQQQHQQEAYRPKNNESGFDTPTSTNLEDISSVLEGFSTNSKDDDARTAGQGVPSLSGYGSNWASPSEVLQLRAMFQEVTARYQREQTRLQAELAKAQEECSAYASERARVQQLQKSYTEGLAQWEKAKQQQGQWAEERALQQLQLEKMLVENQRLQLFIAKKQRLHRSAQGGGATVAPAESSERVQTAVRGVTSAAAEARIGVTSPSPFPVSCGPAGPAVGVTIRPSMAAPHTTAPPPGMPSGEQGGFQPPPAELGGSQGRAAEARSSPYTLLPSESTPHTHTSPPSSTPSPRLQPLPRNQTLNSEGVMGADHTQLPEPTDTAASTEGEVRRMSPSTDAAAYYLSLSSEPLRQYQQQQPAARHRDHTVPTAKKKPDPGQVEGRGDGEGHGHRHSSSLVTPSPTTSGATTTPTSCSSQSAGVPQRRSDFKDHGSSSSSEAEEEDGGRGAAGERSRHFRRACGGAEAEAEDADGGTGGDFDPSYARGATDVSSSSHSRRSNISAGAAAAIATGSLVGAPAQRGHPQEELYSSPLVTSESLGSNRRLTSTTETGDSPHTAAEGSASTETMIRSSVATATTTTTIPSFLASTAATITSRPSASSSSSTTAWSLQYLYHLPRTPAEALQEELRMMKELRRLGDENASLAARLQHVTTLKAMDTDQREQQLLRLVQEHEQARRSAASWELMAKQMQSEVSSLEARCAEARDALSDMLTASKQQQHQAQTRLIESEARCRAALAATREETLMKLSVLRRTWCDFVKQQQQEARSRAPSSADATEDCAELLKTAEGLRAELHAARAAQVDLQDRHHADEMQAKARIAHLESVIVSTRDMLERLTSDKESAALQIDELHAEVERLREAALAREACLHAMEERLRLATGELAAQEEQAEEASTWKARAVSAEADLTTQRAYYEKEINVYKTAACNMQHQHHDEMERAVRRYEKLVVRFEAMKLQLCAVLSDGVRGGGAEWTAHAKTKKRRPPSPGNESENSPNTAAAKSQPQRGLGEVEKAAELIAADASACQQTAKLACDAVLALRTSVAATDRIAKSLSVAASSTAYGSP